MRRSRFWAARRQLGGAKLPPLRTLGVGSGALGLELVRATAERLEPDEQLDVWGNETERLAELVAERPRQRRRRLVRWWQPSEAVPDPVVLGALRSLRSVRGTWLVATDEAEPHQAWSDGAVWDWRVELRLSGDERLAWTAWMLGGAHRDVAAGLVARVGSSPSALRSAAGLVTTVVESMPTTGDLGALVVPDAGRDYADALVAGDARGALRAVDGVTDAWAVLTRLQWRLGDLWALGELRPSAAQRPVRESVELTGLPRWVVEELAPLSRRYPRARVASCTEALAVAHEGLRAVPGQPHSVLKVLVAMWASGR